MKKNLKYFILLLGLIFINISTIKADTCKVISGTGKNLGDEVSCGNEHFYVLSSDKTSTKLLSKYNLYVGEKIEQVGETYYYKDYAEDGDLYTAAEEYYYANVDKYPEDDFYEITKLVIDEFGEINDVGIIFRLITPLTYTEVKQDKKATGLKIVNGEVEYPIYGNNDLDDDEIEEPLDKDGNLILDGTKALEYFNKYKSYLKSKGINVQDINFIHRDGIESFIKEVSGQDVSLGVKLNDEGYLDIDYSNTSYMLDTNEEITKVNITEYIPEKYNWILGTTFWVGSGSTETVALPSSTDEFLTTYGDYCSKVRGCNFGNNIGVGYRPVITVLSNDIVKEEIIKETPKTEENPNTGDNIILYLITSIISLLGLSILIKKEYN